MQTTNIFLVLKYLKACHPKYIGKRDNNCFHVKGGVVTSEHQRQLNKQMAKSLIG